MATVTIRNLDDQLKHRLALRAAQHGRSMEAEVRVILAAAVEAPDRPDNLVEALLERFGSLGGVDLDLPVRHAPPRAPDLAS
ncbi:MAG: plasmid stabilization protein [Solirubrobacterales bacterium]|nr:plasmid stabilization protein [Solirubrobacterales bacterium]